jgi:hypothetical protein
VKKSKSFACQQFWHLSILPRTHWSLNKDSPVSRPVQRAGNIRSRPILGGLHHHYVRV